MHLVRMRTKIVSEFTNKKKQEKRLNMYAYRLAKFIHHLTECVTIPMMVSMMEPQFIRKKNCQ